MKFFLSVIIDLLLKLFFLSNVHFVRGLSLFFILSNLEGYQNLEEYPQDFMLETYKIEIPESPHAFNPSIIRWKGRLLMSFRELSEPSLFCSSGISTLSLIWLNEDFTPFSTSQVLPFALEQGISPEDGRLILLEDRLYLIYSGHKKDLIGITEDGFRVYVAELGYEEGKFYILHNECLSKFEGACKNKREKNWVPFIYENQLLLSYQLKPHKVLAPFLDGSGHVETVAMKQPSLVWEWGELRGGTTALPLDENRYLSFFHSSCFLSTEHSDGESILHYFMGAYTFSREPPFKMEQISPEPLIAKNFYKGEVYTPYWHPLRVIFPCGFIFEKEEIWLFYGRQDHECWVVKIDKNKLLDSLIQVTNK